VNPAAYNLYYQRYGEMGSADFQVLDPENGTDF
jgi:hypothetical protein